MPGQAVGYGVSARGACHLHGGATVGLEALDGRVQVYQKTYAGKGKLVGLTSGTVAMIDSVGACIHAYHHYVRVHPIALFLPHTIRKPLIAYLPSIGLKFISKSPR